MSTKKVVVYICDLCQAEGDGVRPHELHVDGRGVALEACGKCWGRAEKVLGAFVEAGRRVKRGGKSAR